MARSPVRSEPTILHVDLDAFFASVEQRDKPSLRGKPVVVGGVGGRGVVATASYEARTFGVHSAMSTSEARRRCPNAAFLSGRFHAYRDTSRAVMELLRSISPLVEPLSLDEAFVDLEAADLPDHSVDLGQRAGPRPEGPGARGHRRAHRVGRHRHLQADRQDRQRPRQARRAGRRRARAWSRTCCGRCRSPSSRGSGRPPPSACAGSACTPSRSSSGSPRTSWSALLGRAHGAGLYALARAQDDRAVEPEREAKSISVEDTYDTDHVDTRLLEALLDRQAAKVTERLRKARLSGRTVSIKVRLHDFSTLSRSATLSEPSDDARQIARVARRLLGELDTSSGVRLLGVGVSGLADWIQEDLFADEERRARRLPTRRHRGRGRRRVAAPRLGARHGRGARGARPGLGLGVRAGVVVTVRFETAETGPGPVLSFAVADPALAPYRPPEE